jgi:hypothetical protein
MFSHFMYDNSAQRANDIYNEIAERVRMLAAKDAQLRNRSAMDQWQMARAVQASSPFCWQPLPSNCEVVDAWTSTVATADNADLVCIVKRCALTAVAAHCTKVGLELLRFHNEHSRPEAAALSMENDASKFCHPVSYAGKTPAQRLEATKKREAATSPMQYEDRCVLTGTHFAYKGEPCDDETLRTSKVRASLQLTRQCVIAEERSMGIMVAMNKLALELLQRVPSFDVEKMKEVSAGTHDINRKRLAQAVEEAEGEVIAEKGSKGSCKRRRARKEANQVGVQYLLF